MPWPVSSLSQPDRGGTYREVPQPGAGVPMMIHSDTPWISSFLENNEASN
jgi:hypothetical protein